MYETRLNTSCLLLNKFYNDHAALNEKLRFTRWETSLTIRLILQGLEYNRYDSFKINLSYLYVFIKENNNNT